MSFFSSISFSNSWLRCLSKGTMAILWLFIFTIESWDSISNTWGPVLKVLGFFSSISNSNSWLFRSSFCVNFSFCLNKIAVLESAFDKVEEVTNEFRFWSFIYTFEKFRIHFLLEELIQINFQVCFKKCLFSKSNLVHVSIHAHSFNFSLHLSLRFSLESSSIGRAS